MNGLGSWLLALTGPIARQVLAALGIGVVTYAGFDAAIGAVFAQAKAAWGGMPAEAANWLAMAGMNTALSMVAGAVATRLTLATLKKYAKL